MTKNSMKTVAPDTARGNAPGKALGTLLRKVLGKIRSGPPGKALVKVLRMVQSGDPGKTVIKVLRMFQGVAPGKAVIKVLRMVRGVAPGKAVVRVLRMVQGVAPGKTVVRVLRMVQSKARGMVPRTADASAPDQTFSLRSRIIAASIVISFLVFGVGGWATSAQLSGAIIAQGSLVVKNSVKKVQHREGGIVSQIKVRNGDKVKAGDILIKLDDTQVRSALGVVKSQIIELLGRRARLAAERDGYEIIKFPTALMGQSDDAMNIIKGEQRVFDDNRSIGVSRKQQLQLRIEQFEQEIKGLTAQRDSKAREFRSVIRELAPVRRLHKQRLATIVRLNTLERQAEQITGSLGGLDAQIARVKGQISEVRLQILSIDQNARTEAQRELRGIEAKLTELNERRTAAEDKLKRMDLRAPMSGIVHQLAVHTIGGVVNAAEPLLLIVPVGNHLTVEVQFASTDIDQLTVGHPAKIRFSAFNQRTTPELPGYITHVAADVTRDPKTGKSFYLGQLELEPGTLKQIGDRKLLPGMPAEVFITTSKRTALSYFIKPFTDQLTRAFRED